LKSAAVIVMTTKALIDHKEDISQKMNVCML